MTPFVSFFFALGVKKAWGDGNELMGFSDADWAGDVNTRRSTSGYVFRYGNSTVTWSSRKQNTVAKSSTEAEYVALSGATQEVIWLRRLFGGLGLDVNRGCRLALHIRALNVFARKSTLPIG